MTRVKTGVANLFLPLFGLSISARAATGKAANALVPRADLLQQNEQFRKENQELRLKLSQDQEVWRENERLRKVLALRAQSPWKQRLARVIGRDPANWWKSVRIDLGSRDGIRPNYPALTVDGMVGLVGRVATVDDSWSQVILLGDPNLRVGAIVLESHESGIIQSGNSSSPLNNLVDLAYLSGSSAVKPGQMVYTSGDGGLFPRGILIGKVLDTHTVSFGLATEARVQLAAKPDELEEVWILLP
jgi:rod shape-determining protein MreC